MSDKEKRIPSLDGLRAISIIFVIFAHVAGCVILPEWAERMGFLLGGFGVRVFFVISGFLITSLLLYENANRGKISLSAFYKRRALRILPVYYFYILTVFILDRSGWLPSIAVSSFVGAATFTTRLWGDWAHNAYPLSDWPLFHTWSLSVEEQFYLLWPIALCWLTGRRKTNNVLGGGIVALTIIFMATASRFIFIHFLNLESLANYLFLTQADSIMCGCLLALLVTSSSQTLLRIINFHPHISRLAAVALLVISLSSIKVPFIFGPTFGPSVQSALIACLIGSFTLVRSGISYHFLNFSPLQWIGRLSYSLYIWQQLFLFSKSMAVFWVQRFPQNLAFVLLAAMASYYFIEKPFLNLKKRFSKIRHTPLESQASS